MRLWISYRPLSIGFLSPVCNCQVGVDVQFPTQPPVRLGRVFFCWRGVEFQFPSRSLLMPPCLRELGVLPFYRVGIGVLASSDIGAEGVISLSLGFGETPDSSLILICPHLGGDGEGYPVTAGGSRRLCSPHGLLGYCGKRALLTAQWG